MEEFICKICNEKLSGKNRMVVTKLVQNHLKKKHFISSKDYFDKYMKKEDEGICPQCGKETKFLGLYQRYYRFCCYSHRTTWLNLYDPKIVQIRKETGRKSGKKVWSNPETRKKLTEICRQNNLDPNCNWGPRFTKEELSERAKGQNADIDSNFGFTTPERIKFNSEQSMRMNLDPNCNWGKSYKGGYYKDVYMRSSWERSFAEKLDKNNIKWKYEPKVIELNLSHKKRYIPDFYLPEFDLWIEIKPEYYINQQLFEVKQKFEEIVGRTLHILQDIDFDNFIANLESIGAAMK